MKKRIYVMDCGNFVKIGVSQNTEQRKDQIPYEIKQYYCTEPIENAFGVERIIHNILSDKRENNARGREYFNISFDSACDCVRDSLMIFADCEDKEHFKKKFSMMDTEKQFFIIGFMWSFSRTIEI